MNLTKKFGLNVFASYAAMSAMVVIAFFFTPFLIKHIGKARYGLWVLAMSMGQYTTLFDLGFLSAIRRFQSKAMAAGAPEEINEVFGISMRIYVPLGILACLTCLSSILWLPMIANIPAELSAEFMVLMIAVGLYMLLNFSRAGFTGIIFGANRLDLDKAILVIQRACLAGVTVVLLLYWRSDIYSPSVGAVAAMSVCLLIAFALAKMLFPSLRLNLGRRHSPLVRPMLKFALGALVLGVSGIIIGQTPNLIVGHYMDMEAVAYLAIPMLLSGRIRQFVSATALPMWPMASRLDSRGDKEALQSLYVRGTRLCLLAALSVAVPLTLFGESFIRLWVGPDFAWTWQILLVLLIGLTFQMAQYPGANVLKATKNIHGLGYSKMVCAAGIVVGCIAVLKWTQWGLIGVAWSLTIPMIVRDGLYVPINVCNQLNLSFARYYLRTYAGPMVLAAAAIGLCALVRTYWSPPHLAWSVVEILTTAAIIFLLGVFAVMDKVDRKRILSLVRREK